VAGSIYRLKREHRMGISHADVEIKENNFNFFLFYSLRHSPKVKNVDLSFSYSSSLKINA
jgi:hypothetical protein